MLSLLTLAAANPPERSIVLDLVIILAAAAGVVMLLRHARIGAIPAYLLTGALIGPHAFGLVSSGENVQAIAGLATILLLFIVGLHLDPSGLSGGMVRVFVLGAVSTMVAVLAMWPLLGSGELGMPGGLAVAIALAMSSTAVVLRILAQRRETHRVHGRLIFGTLVVQDLLALAGLAVLPLLAAWAGPAAKGRMEAGAQSAGGAPGDAGAHGAVLLPADWPGWARFIVAVGGIAVLIVVCRRVLPWLMREAARHTSQEVPLVLSAAVALAAAVLAAGLGFSPELGAFLAGFLLAGTPFKYQLSGQLVPLRDLFMAVFFTAVGLQVDARVAADGWQLIVVAVLALVLVKTASMGLVAWLLGSTPAVGVIFALSLFQAGEFSIVILSVAHSLGLFDAEMMARLIVVVVLSLTITPPMFVLGHRLRPLAVRIPVAGWSRAGALREPTPAEESAADAAAAGTGVGERGKGRPSAKPLREHVIVAGFGVVGRAIADRLEIAGVPFCVVDLNQQTIRTQRKLGRHALYGDVSNPDVLESAGVEHAAGVVLTIPDDEATLRACRVVRTLSPHVFIAARTSFLSKAIAATQLGADHVTVEEVATAEMMARQVMDRLESRGKAQG
ncbi:MAG: cation:proton antiporter [Phycisphaerales bacterium]|nr:cation:proton antiporter [Phycisphaerales bacterium]